MSAAAEALAQVEDPSTLHTLIFDCVRTAELTKPDKQFLEQFRECRNLSLAGLGLRSLKNLPDLPKLQHLSLRDNALLGDDLYNIKITYPSLRVLDLSNNQIKELAHLYDLHQLELLEVIFLAPNPVQEQNNYRGNFWEKVAQCKVLDGFYKDMSLWHGESPFTR
jgi:Leucine-rich repeat (LRR) protein